MKKILPLIFTLVMCLNLCACDQRENQIKETSESAKGVIENIDESDVAENAPVTEETSQSTHDMPSNTSNTPSSTDEITFDSTAETANETHAHSYSQEVINPTCTEQGYTIYQCSCGDVYMDDIVSAKGHAYTEEVINPTCTEQGYTIYQCSCGDVYMDDIVSAKGHAYTEEVIDPTCIEQGYTIYQCSCGDYYEGNYTDGTHNYSNHICAICGDIEESYSYEYLLEWVKTQDNSTIVLLSNSLEYCKLYIYQGVLKIEYGCGNRETSGGVANVALNGTNQEYEYSYRTPRYTVDHPEITYVWGTINGATYTGYTLENSRYSGDEWNRENYVDHARFYINYALDCLAEYLEENIPEITLSDLGFYVFE